MPYKNLISEVLSAHADQLLKKQNRSRDYTALFPDNQDLPKLLTLADHVKAALEPVAPSNDFKERLQRDLMAAAHLKQHKQQNTPSTPISNLTPVIISGFIALAGLFYLTRRQQ